MADGVVGSDRRKRLVVVGGGLAGLATAHRAVGRHPDWDVIVLEAQGRVGGRLRSDVRGGFVLEGGPMALSATTEVERLLHALALPASPVVPERRLRLGGRLHAAPASIGDVWRSAPISAWARLRALAEPLIARGGGEESVHAFLARRFGREVADALAAAAVAEVSAGDPHRVSLDASFPRWRRLEQRDGSLLGGAVRSGGRFGGRSGVRARSWAIAGGSERLAAALAASLGGQVHLEARVSAVTWQRSGPASVAIEHPIGHVVIEADAVVLAVPAFAAAELLARALPGPAAALGRIRYADVVSVGFGFAPGVVRGWIGGVVVARGEGVRGLAVQRGEGDVNLRWLGGGVMDPGLIAASDEEIEGAARADLRALFGIDAVPRVSAIRRWPRGLPQYELGHETRVETARQALLLHGAPVALAGDYLEGAGVEDVLRSVREAVATVMGVPSV